MKKREFIKIFTVRGWWEEKTESSSMIIRQGDHSNLEQNIKCQNPAHGNLSFFISSLKNSTCPTKNSWRGAWSFQNHSWQILKKSEVKYKNKKRVYCFSKMRHLSQVWAICDWQIKGKKKRGGGRRRNRLGVVTKTPPVNPTYLLSQEISSLLFSLSFFHFPFSSLSSSFWVLVFLVKGEWYGYSLWVTGKGKIERRRRRIFFLFLFLMWVYIKKDGFWF